ncbi:MAG: hypothetical protein ACRC6V_04250 [Bacteroidales bacterium]
MKELEGKWVLLDSIMQQGIVSKQPRLVTSVSKTRAYVSKRDYEGNLEEDSFVNIKTIKYVFEDEQSAKDCGEKCWKIWWNWWEDQCRNMKETTYGCIESFGGVPVK